MYFWKFFLLTGQVLHQTVFCRFRSCVAPPKSRVPGWVSVGLFAGCMFWSKTVSFICIRTLDFGKKRPFGAILGLSFISPRHPWRGKEKNKFSKSIVSFMYTHHKVVFPEKQLKAFLFQ